MYFATQVATAPPTIVIITNGPELFDNTYQRFLLKTFRDQLPFHDVPIKLYLRRRSRDDGTTEEPEELAVEKSKASPRKMTRKPAPRPRTKRSQLWKD